MSAKPFSRDWWRGIFRLQRCDVDLANLAADWPAIAIDFEAAAEAWACLSEHERAAAVAGSQRWHAEAARALGRRRVASLETYLREKRWELMAQGVEAVTQGEVPPASTDRPAVSRDRLVTELQLQQALDARDKELARRLRTEVHRERLLRS
jgi:hypothetical protein